MPKVYLSPAYHYWNPCAVAGCDETTHNNLYLDVLEPYLAACGIQYKRGPRRTPKSGEDGDALMRRYGNPMRGVPTSTTSATPTPPTAASGATGP